MAKEPIKAVQDEPKTLSEIGKQDAAHENKAVPQGAVETKEPETKDTKDKEPETTPAATEEQNAYIQDLEQRIVDLERLLKLAVNNKPQPGKKRLRPAGEYKLVSPFWDGRVRKEPGEIIRFAEGVAPQSAKFLG